jgi:hypothetical protein
MDEVKGTRGQGIAGNVMAPNDEIRRSPVAQETGVNVCCNHSSCGSDALAEPVCDRSAARSHFQAMPPGSKAAGKQMTLRARIEHLRQRVKACRRVRFEIE